MSRSLRTRRDDRGVVALEMVLAVPALLMLIIAVVVLGNFLSVKTQTSGLARDGARAASLNLTLPAGTTVISGSCVSRDPTKFVTVQATKPVSLRSIPFVPLVLPDEIEETVTMRCGG